MVECAADVTSREICLPEFRNGYRHPIANLYRLRGQSSERPFCVLRSAIMVKGFVRGTKVGVEPVAPVRGGSVRYRFQFALRPFVTGAGAHVWQPITEWLARDGKRASQVHDMSDVEELIRGQRGNAAAH